MSDSRFDHVYDPVATPNPAYDDDFEPSPAAAGSWDRRDLAQALLHRARARQEAIADAFVDALLDGKIQLFRILLELEKAALTAEREAEDARRPGLADILLPMLERERAQAAANAAQNASPKEPSPEADRPFPSLSAPTESDSTESVPPQPGITDIQSAADEPTTPTCRSRTVAHNHRRARTRAALPHAGWKGSPETRQPVRRENARPLHASPSRRRCGGGAPTVPLTLLTLTAVAAPESASAIHIPIRFESYGSRRPRSRISRCNSFKQNGLHA